MATPLSADRLLRALRDEGLRVVEHRSWRTHNRNHKGLWGPVHGVMIHHTVTSGTMSSVELCYNGHSTLPGPLCHGVIDKDGTVYLVGNGRANHAGLGDDDVLRAVIDERELPPDNEANTDGNRHFYGFEAINLGDGRDTWPAAQLEAIEKALAAICRAHGWGWRSALRHLDWQPGKVDPRGVDWPAMQARIAARLSGAPTTTSPSEEDDMPLTDADVQRVAKATVHMLIAGGGTLENSDLDRIWNRDIIPAARPPHANEDYETNRTWSAKYALQTGVEAGRQTLAKVTELVDALDRTGVTDAQIAAIAEAVAKHPALATAIADKLAARLAE